MSEKLRVRFDIAGGDLRPRSINGRELPEWQQGPAMAVYLRQLSEQGWRLAEHLEGQEYLFETANGPHGAVGTTPSIKHARRAEDWYRR